MAARIIASWEGRVAGISSVDPSMFGGIGYEIERTIDLHIHGNFYKPMNSWWQIAVRFVGYLLNGLVVTQFASTYCRNISASTRSMLGVRATQVWLLLTLCMLPMFILLSCDYGRLYLYLTAVTVMALMVIPVQRLSDMVGWVMPAPLAMWQRRLDHSLTLRHRQWMFAILLLFAGASPYWFSFGLWWNSTIAGTVCHMVSRLMTIIG